MQWYYVDTGGNQLGPSEEAELKNAWGSGSLTAECLCWNETMGDWAEVGTLPDLMATLNPPKPAAPKPMGGPPPRGGPPMGGPPGGGFGGPPGGGFGGPPAGGPSGGGFGGPPGGMGGGMRQPEKKEDPGHGWKEMMTPEGIPYYYNSISNITSWDKPDELKTEADMDKQGDWRWMPHSEEGYVAARFVQERMGTFQCETDRGEMLSCKKRDLPGGVLEKVNWSALRRLESDLVLLTVMNRPLILHNLKERFLKNEIYTNVGTILIACNPYKSLPLYTHTVIDSYIKKGNRKLPPHVYGIADNAFQNLRDKSMGQSIVISGESGAGKTECTKQALQYLAEIAGSSTGVEQRILHTNPILEAFGNAKTVRNNNSSRFGKYVEIFFDKKSEICGAQNTNYLLEKVRVVYQGKGTGERNYHAFYQMLAGFDQSKLSQLKLTPDMNQYNYLNQSGCTTVDGIDDVREHEDVLKAMRDLGFSQTEQDNVYTVLAAVLLLGQVTFRDIGDRKCEVTNKTGLDNVAQLLQVDSKQLLQAVLTRTMTMRGQDPISIPLSSVEAIAARDALAKFIYEKQFDWLVQRMNSSIGKGNAGFKGANIGILDIFGFEIFEKNQFEQLCINFTNEKLQQFFNAHTFKKEETVYKAEGIKFDHVAYIDNQPVLDLIEQKPIGILPMIDEELRMPKGSDDTFVAKLILKHNQTKEFQEVRQSAKLFCVKHYAGDVVYESEGFLEKNKDRLNDIAYECVSKTNFQYLGSMFPKDSGMATSKVTLGSKFRKQLDELMKTLNATEPHYIRCIKSNPNKAPLEFAGQMCLEQLQYSGVFEAIEIRKKGFPFRLTHDRFFKRYKCTMGDKRWSGPALANCKVLIQHMGQNFQTVQIGSTMILYRADAHREMELKRNLALEGVTIFLQKFCKAKLAATLKARAVKVKPVCANALASKSLEKCEMALSMAAKVGFEIFEIKALKKMKNDFYEAQRLNREFEALVCMNPYECFDMFKSGVEQADNCDLHSPISEQVRQMYWEALAYRQALDEDAANCMITLDKPVMLDVIERAQAIDYMTPAINDIRELLYNTSEETFVKKQLKAANQLNDRERTVRREIKLKDIVLLKSGQMFNFQKSPSLMDPVSWADQKFFGFGKEELAQGMLKWTKTPIHCSLQDLSQQVASDGKTKMKSLALKIFKNILGFMGDKKSQYPDQLAIEILNWAMANPVLRDEAFFQLMKQLSNNPEPQSRQRGWQLMQIFIDTIKPQVMAENYVEMFLRNNAQPMEKFINTFHQTYYGGPRTQPPTPEEIQQIYNWSSPLRLGFDPSIEMEVQTAGSRLGPPQSSFGGPGGGGPPRGGPPMGGPPAGNGGFGGPPAGGPPMGGPPAGGPPGGGFGGPPAGGPPGGGFGGPPAGGPPGGGFGGPPGGGFGGSPMGGPPGGFGGPPAGGPPRGGPPMGGPPRPQAPQPAPQPPPIADYPWHFMDLGQNQCGPVPPAEVRAAWKAGTLDGTCIAWCEVMSDWQEIANISDLLAYCSF